MSNHKDIEVFHTDLSQIGHDLRAPRIAPVELASGVDEHRKLRRTD
jgi:hypothetical protein